MTAKDYALVPNFLRISCFLARAFTFLILQQGVKNTKVMVLKFDVHGTVHR